MPRALKLDLPQFRESGITEYFPQLVVKVVVTVWMGITFRDRQGFQINRQNVNEVWLSEVWESIMELVVLTEQGNLRNT